MMTSEVSKLLHIPDKRTGFFPWEKDVIAVSPNIINKILLVQYIYTLYNSIVFHIYNRSLKCCCFTQVYNLSFISERGVLRGDLQLNLYCSSTMHQVGCSNCSHHLSLYLYPLGFGLTCRQDSDVAGLAS